jgi:uncharacterized paraquat-inducible protein A
VPVRGIDACHRMHQWIGKIEHHIMTFSCDLAAFVFMFVEFMDVLSMNEFDFAISWSDDRISMTAWG